MSSNAFRSHLMQQLMAQARGQRHPPLALVSQLDHVKTTTSDRSTHTSSSNYRSTDKQWGANKASSQQKRSYCAAYSESISSPKPTRTTLNKPKRSSLHLHTSARVKQASDNSSNSSDIDNAPDETDCELNVLAQHFQRLLQNQHDTSSFSPIHLDSTRSNDTAHNYNLIQMNIRDAIFRAIKCATRASKHHHKKEPFTFYRMLTPSSITDRLFDISYNVSLQNGKSNEQAWNKREKWRKEVRAFIAVCVGGQPNQEEESGSEKDSLGKSTITTESREIYDAGKGITAGNDDTWWYGALPFHPPLTQRQLEDYAAASVAIQNIQLSLQSENIACKWSSGPIIKCRAFRSLLGCTKNDLIAGLIMVGLPRYSEPGAIRNKGGRASKKYLKDDMLIDL